ncbi:PAS domain-containing protein [Marivita sp. S0852]|uniref:PAS domain-containing protein n=1 Tax=Marivita sp. S0852 TaxID=3373893 RepID=UPI0039820A10
MHSPSLMDQALTQHQADAVQIVDRYWHHLAKDGTVPDRASIDPGAIQDALEYAFIAEHLSAGHARLRVAGGSINAALGMEASGMPLAALVNPAARQRFTDQIAKCLEDPAKVTMTLRSPVRFGQPALNAQLWMYPLRDARGVCKLLGTFITTGLLDCTPRRFEITAVTATPVARATPAPRPALISRGHLRLVVSN